MSVSTWIYATGFGIIDKYDPLGGHCWDGNLILTLIVGIDDGGGI